MNFGWCGKESFRNQRTLNKTITIALRSYIACSTTMVVALPVWSKLAVCMLVSRIILPATPIRVQAGNINHEVAGIIQLVLIHFLEPGRIKLLISVKIDFKHQAIKWLEYDMVTMLTISFCTQQLHYLSSHSYPIDEVWK